MVGRNVLELILPHPEYLYKSRFGFLQRHRVLQAVLSDPRLQALTEAMEILNEMRNALAHQLEPVKVKQLAPVFIEAAFNAARYPPKLGFAVRKMSNIPCSR